MGTQGNGLSLRVAEVFRSIQGEGVTAGLPSAFVRLQGCTHGCGFCDTRYTWPAGGGTEEHLSQVLDRVKAFDVQNVVVTGGEPLESPAFVPLVEGLKAGGHRIEVETAGYLVPPEAPVDQWNVSVKLANAGVPRERRICSAAIRAFVERLAWFKFVIVAAGDVDEVEDLVGEHAIPRDRVLLMPEGMTRAAVLERSPMVAAQCQRHGFRFSPRLHILLWGPKRGV